MDGRAAITFAAPHGAECVVLGDGDIVGFGRGAACGIRFAFAPEADPGVPRWAGRFIAAGGRLFIESAAEIGHRSISVQTPGAPAVQLARGEGHSPAGSEWWVTVHGEVSTWRLTVNVREPDAVVVHADDAPTHRFTLQLTPHQRRALDAYSAPLRRGRLEPATHREAALALGCHPNSAREAIYEIWARMFAAAIPMPDVGDKRIAVVEAARLHGLLSDGPGDA